MSDEPKKTDEPKKPGPYDSVDDGTFRGVDPSQPQQYRDRKNARRNGPKQRYAEGTDPDAWGE